MFQDFFNKIFKYQLGFVVHRILLEYCFFILVGSILLLTVIHLLCFVLFYTIFFMKYQTGVSNCTTYMVIVEKDLIQTLSIFLLSHVPDMHTMLKFSFLEMLQMKLCLCYFSVIKPLLLPIMISIKCSLSSGYLSDTVIQRCHSMAIDQPQLPKMVPW